MRPYIIVIFLVIRLVEAVFEGDFGFFKQRYLSDINLINFR